MLMYGTKTILNIGFLYHLLSTFLIVLHFRKFVWYKDLVVGYFVYLDEKIYIKACIVKLNLKLSNFKHEVF